jgi:hypothetical protein
MSKKIPQTIQSSYQFESDEEAIRVLKSEGKRLERIAKKVWQRIMASPQPKVYIRTQNAEKSIKLGKVKKLDNNTWGIELTYENDLAYHDSWFDKQRNDGQRKYEQGHAIMLISSGWKAINLERKIGVRKRFTRYKGTNYLGEVVKAFNASKHKGITLEVQWSGKRTR